MYKISKMAYPIKNGMGKKLAFATILLGFLFVGGASLRDKSKMVGLFLRVL